MNDAEVKRRAAERDAFLRYLDRRLPELHGLGKKHGHTAAGTVAEQVVHTRENLETADYPGVTALWAARAEWGAMSAEQRAAAVGTEQGQG